MPQLSERSVKKLFDIAYDDASKIQPSEHARSLLLERIRATPAISERAEEVAPAFAALWRVAHRIPQMPQQARAGLLRKIRLDRDGQSSALNDEIVWSAAWKFALCSTACAMFICSYAERLPDPTAPVVIAVFPSADIF